MPRLDIVAEVDVVNPDDMTVPELSATKYWYPDNPAPLGSAPTAHHTRGTVDHDTVDQLVGLVRVGIGACVSRYMVNTVPVDTIPSVMLR